MKKIRLELDQKEINNIADKQFEFSLYDKTNIIDAIIEVDKIIIAKGEFPTKEIQKRSKIEYHSLLHMLYNPVEDRIYKHIILAAFSKSCPYFIDKNNPRLELPEDITIRIVLRNICGDEAPEAILDYEIFQKAMLKQGYKIS